MVLCSMQTRGHFRKVHILGKMAASWIKNGWWKQVIRICSRASGQSCHADKTHMWMYTDLSRSLIFYPKINFSQHGLNAGLYLFLQKSKMSHLRKSFTQAQGLSALPCNQEVLVSVWLQEWGIRQAHLRLKGNCGCYSTRKKAAALPEALSGLFFFFGNQTMNYLGIASEEALYQRTFLSLLWLRTREKQSSFY